MKQASNFVVHPGWKLMLHDMGLNPYELMALADLPQDLFGREGATLSTEEYFRLWDALETITNQNELPLLIAGAISVEAFDAPLFAAFCSPNLNIALKRLSLFKSLIGPLYLDVDISSKGTSASISVYQFEGVIPRSIGLMEVVFLTRLARMATREELCPISATVEVMPDDPTPYKTFLGVELKQGSRNQISFSFEDANRPFISENRAMWECFEPELKRRLSDLEKDATITQRVKSALLEMLPTGDNSMDEVANRLAMSKRTLQRKLSAEGGNFQSVLNKTRQELAHHYLSNSSMSQGEISYLLGFQDTNSFIRAYSAWTGQSPGQYRAAC